MITDTGNIGKIEPYIAAWVTPEGFEELYYQYCKEYSKDQLAYEAAERMYVAHFGMRRYSSYLSFKVVRNRRLRKLVMKNKNNH